MHSIDVHAHLLEVRLRTERANRRASLLSSLGPLPKRKPLRLFSRRVVALPAPVDIRHHGDVGANARPQRAA
jgi:hypothetical protein